MKHLILIFSFLLVITIASKAQNTVIDTHPEATIYIIDPQSGQEVMANSDDAILFKDAFIKLVNNTERAKLTIKAPGHKSLVITQSDPADGNAYQLTLSSRIFGHDVTIYTFSYSVDQNTLYFYDTDSQTWNPELVQGYNVVNLNNCLALGKFNEVQNNDQNENDNTQADDGSDDAVYADAPPPPLQDYDQPEAPADDYLWQPGYWAYSRDGGYYWVAGTWVAPPSVGLLWTPPYWGYEGSRYVFHSGYWGNDIGFYGGVDYGYGYGGRGFAGGQWEHGHFMYNSAVLHVGTRVHNVYVDRSVVRVGVRVKVSFNGGGGGTNARPTPIEQKAAGEQHVKDHSQNPKAAKNGGNNGNNNSQKGGNRNNGNKGAGNSNANQKEPGDNNTTPKGAGNTDNNAPKGPGNGGNGTPKAPGNGNNNGVPKGPGNGAGGNGIPKGPGSGGNGIPRGPGNGGNGIPRGPGNGNNNSGVPNGPGNGNGGQTGGTAKTPKTPKAPKAPKPPKEPKKDKTTDQQ